MALDLRARGVILAVCSKNDDRVARHAFREHPEMLLREEHIAVFQANWTDKASNLRAIAQALNIGIDALVFLTTIRPNACRCAATSPLSQYPNCLMILPFILACWPPLVISRQWRSQKRTANARLIISG